MADIRVSGSLIPSAVNTPLDKRGRVAAFADIAAVEMPFVGLLIYCEDDHHTYRVMSLKERIISGIPVANAAIDAVERLPELADNVAASITLPVPFDDNGDNVSLVIDFCETPDFADGDYTRVTMAVWFAKMRVFDGSKYVTMTGQSLGLPDYGRSVSFTLDNEMFPGYVPGAVYYARYSWMDTQGGYSDWKGFRFSGDVADFEPIRTNYRATPKVKPETAITGTPTLDYLEGEIQNYYMSSDVTVNLNNINNLPFGEALIINVRRTSGTLTVTASGRTQTYTESKTYMIVATNFGVLNIAVTETI